VVLTVSFPINVGDYRVPQEIPCNCFPAS
jgi:hypothetical protein